ncbi:hypothetical protein IFM61606_04706 [Aspergillus udagawae]|uniref:Uncharacterized protein n=1 Tax=Aspergillus udagawae TaxID=91492 RepID=A0ABQ1AEU9_9EURO|nr:hypothetical protein IFM51744_09965 [Aspergillus udagawae]GFF80419.1 hypothetical protein IFM53868_02854 [Aspergillus udagawae]GFG09042.1 hypothetical protein IFM5058_04227 [Aspergillus udagawae]GFG24786.1 hypothetical protein IFM61606_04706 [Aspergillus udagawae]
MNNLDLELQTLPGAETGVPTNGRQRLLNRDFQSISALASVPRWWLTDSKGDVKIVLIILINQIKREISVEMYKLINRPTSAELSKKGGGVSQRVVISQLTAQGQIRISGAPLVLSFGRVFLRPAGPNEGDIEFGTADLERIASKVWRVYTQV